MSWVSSGMQWLATMDANKVTALATVVSAVGSVVVAGATYWLGKLTRTLARETRLTREAVERADVQCVVEPHAEHIVLVELVMTNLGRATAESVKIAVESGGHFRDGKRPTLYFSRLLPGSIIRTSLGSFPSMSEEEKRLKVQIGFSDKFGKHAFIYEQDLNGLLGLVRVGNTASYKIVGHLAKVARNLEQIEKRLHKLPVDLHGRREREEEAAAERERDCLWEEEVGTFEVRPQLPAALGDSQDVGPAQT